MRLIDDAGHGVDLRVVGYQFPDAEDPAQRYSWHMVEGGAVGPEGSWGFRYPALTCDESPRVAAWLRDAGAAGLAVAEPLTVVEPLTFTEPNLSLAVVGRGAGVVVLDVGLEQEFSPPWRRGRCVIRCRFTPEQVDRAAAEWDEEIAAYPDGMPREEALRAFAAEGERLASVMLGLAPADWSRPTACVPWTVADLLAHVLTAVARISGMLEAPAPAVADRSAVDYYRPDDRFSAGTNTERVDTARQRAATTDGRTLARELDEAWRRIGRLCAQEPLSRTVRTRHGDAMLLTDFLTTRVVELGVHGLDLAAALGRQPWLTRPAADLLTTLLLGTGGVPTLRDLGWDAVTFVAKATNRRPMTPEEAQQLERAGLRRLSLG